MPLAFAGFVLTRIVDWPVATPLAIAISISDPLGSTKQFGYDGADLTSVTNPLGQTTRQFVDAAGRVL